MPYKDPEKLAEYRRSDKYKNSRRKAGISPDKWATILAKDLARKRKNPEKMKSNSRWTGIKIRHRLTKAAWLSLFASQGNCCAVCQSPVPKSKKGWATDHSHISGNVRGILCSLCNIILGMAKDDPSILKAAAKYLECQEKSSACDKA